MSSLQAVAPALRTPRRWQWLRWTALSVVMLLVLGAASSYWMVRNALPQLSGLLKVPGMAGTVTVYRDEWGIPHLEAGTRHDLFLAQGFVTAQDRLWQMDMMRRMASGRLAEVVGPSEVISDEFALTLTLRRSAEQSMQLWSPWVLADVQAYANGVNAYITDAVQTGKLPIEFRLMGYKPEPWTPLDTALVSKVLANSLTFSWGEEIGYQLMAQKLGPELTRQLFPAYPADSPVIAASPAAVSDGQESVPPEPFAPMKLDLTPLLAELPTREPSLGSNSWVVSGRLTKSGKPILANDPHLSMDVPSVWYETHLVLNSQQEQMNVAGVTYPGAPGIIIGHTDKIAWGVTHTQVDVQDFYIETRNPDDPYQFLYDGRWEKAKVYNETIKVKGEADHHYEVLVTRHGPLVTDVTYNRPIENLAMRWTALEPTTEMEAILLMNKATNWSEFKAALSRWAVPSMNFVFASVNGDIAYRPAGLFPVRASGTGLLPYPGDSAAYEWQGWVPFDKLPEVVNPPAGFIVTANNKIASGGAVNQFSESWAPPYRAQRITESLAGASGLTIEDMQRLQTDLLNVQARTYLPVMLKPVEQAALSQTERAALDTLTNWDYRETGESPAPLLYHLWRDELCKEIFAPSMGEAVFHRMPDQDVVTDAVLKQAAEGHPGDWMRKAGGLSDVAVRSFRSAVAAAVKLQGENPQRWSWAKYHELRLQHPIGQAVPPLGWLLNPGTYPLGGSAATVNVSAPFKGTGLVRYGAAWRTVVDMAEPAGSRAVLTPGQSGSIGSQWYRNQAPLQANGQLRTQSFAPEEYRRGLQLRLLPR